MPPENTETKKKDGVILLIDMLGTKRIMERENPEKFMEDMRLFEDHLRKSIEKGVEDSRLFEKEFSIQIHQFSDTYIIEATSSNSIGALLVLLLRIQTFYAITFSSSRFFRGAISVGTYYTDNTRIIGPAINDAGEWYESAEWIGIHFTPKTSYAIKKELLLKDNFLRHCVIEYNIPLKNNNEMKGYVWNWPQISFINTDIIISEDNINHYKRQILDTFSKHPIGKNEYLKYKNTLDFIDHVFKNISWTGGKNINLDFD
ncbi:MAG: hypothetical protein PHS34_08455 [Candidatus Omnitrophica bacterium]|nr:hypothetical protein [Candidatus Nanoarchaeia archaeon]MDD5551276.1 hypothetical protein [Candidatus Omnitrophota bacterium]